MAVLCAGGERVTDAGRYDYTIRPAQRSERWLIVHRVLRERLDPTRLDWRRFVVAEDVDGEILGFAQIKGQGLEMPEFGSLVVEPDARDQGVGGALLRHLVDPAPKPLYLTCGEHNVGFYRRHGFRLMREDEMPPQLLRKWRVLSRLARLFGVRGAFMIRTE